MSRKSKSSYNAEETLGASYGFRLGFSLIECQSCGIGRIRGVICADCGAEPAPHEFDHKRQRRQQTARRALMRLEQDVGVGSDSSASPSETAMRLYAQLEGLPRRFFSALQGTVDDRYGHAEELDKAVDEIRACLMLVASTRRLRPWYRLLDTASALVTELNHTGVSYLRVLLANTPLEAQAEARNGQAHLDKVAELAPELIAASVVWTSDSIDPLGLMLDILNLGFESAGVSNCIELEGSGRAMAQRIFGPDANLQLGAGLMISLACAASRQLFDEQLFIGRLRESRDFLLSHPVKLAETLSSPHLKSDLAEAAGGLTVASLIFQAVNAARLPNHANIAALMDLGKSAMESLGKRVVAAVQSVGVRSSYETLRDKGVADVLNASRNGRAKTALAGLDLSVRHAGAHMDFKVENDKVVLAPDKNRLEFSFDEFVDHFIQNIEVLYANHIALLVVAGEQGVDLFDLSFMDLLGLRLEAKISFCLSLWGWNVSAVRVSDGCLEVSAELTLDAPFIAPIKTALSLLPAEIGFAKFAIKSTNASNYSLEGPVLPLAGISGRSDGGDSLVEVASKWRLDGLPLISPRAMRRWSAGQCMAAVDEEFGASIRRLRYLRELTEAANDAELSMAIRNLISAVRVQAQGFDANCVTRAKAEFAEWLSIRINPASEMIVDNLATVEAWRSSENR